MGNSRQPQSEAEGLTLTVWRPPGTPSDARLPVAFWIHGGALEYGASTWELTSDAAFARDGVILVSANYRLGAFGFLDVGLVTGEDEAVNLGLQDLMLALAWVNQHIAAFGGDPDRVTVFGESAGGALANALIGHPRTRGLFRRAILQSGSSVQLQAPDDAARFVREAERLLGFDFRERAALEAVQTSRLVTLTVELARARHVTEGRTRPWMLTRDDHVLPADGLEVVEHGGADGIDLMVGWTTDEYRLRWLAQEPELTPIERLSEADAYRALQLYGALVPDAKFMDVQMQITSDQAFRAPATRIADAHADRGNRVFAYEFAWPTPVLDGRLGACHALELPFVFDNLIAPAFHGDSPPQALATLMHGAWVRFFECGEPMPSVRWAIHTPERRPVFRFDHTSGLTEDPDAEIREFWRNLPKAAIGIA